MSRLSGLFNEVNERKRAETSGTLSASVEADITELTVGIEELTADKNDIEDLALIAAGLDDLADVAVESLSDGGLTKVSGGVLQTAVQSQLRLLGVEEELVPSQEAYYSDVSNVESTEVAVENIKLIIKNVWDAILRAIDSVIAKIKSWWANFSDFLPKLKKRAEALKKSVDETKGSIKDDDFILGTTANTLVDKTGKVGDVPAGLNDIKTYVSKEMEKYTEDAIKSEKEIKESLKAVGIDSFKEGDDEALITTVTEVVKYITDFFNAGSAEAMTSFQASPSTLHPNFSKNSNLHYEAAAPLLGNKQLVREVTTKAKEAEVKVKKKSVKVFAGTSKGQIIHDKKKAVDALISICNDKSSIETKLKEYNPKQVKDSDQSEESLKTLERGQITTIAETVIDICDELQRRRKTFDKAEASTKDLKKEAEKIKDKFEKLKFKGQHAALQERLAKATSSMLAKDAKTASTDRLLFSTSVEGHVAKVCGAALTYGERSLTKYGEED